MYGEVDAGGTGGTGGTEGTGRAVHLAAQANSWIPGHLLSASCLCLERAFNLKPSMLLIDPTPNPVLFLSFLPGS